VKYSTEIFDYKLSPGNYGICSDLHVGSPFFDFNQFREYVRYLNANDVETLFIAGDLFEYNDLYQNRVSLEDYLTEVRDFFSFIKSLKLDIYVIKGNQDIALKNYYKSIYDQIEEIVNESGCFLLDAGSFRLMSGGNVVYVAHELQTILANKENIINTNSFLLDGHSHMDQINFVANDGVQIRLGGFRRHYNEEVRVSGILLSVDNQKNIHFEKVGEMSSLQESIIENLNKIGFSPIVKTVELTDLFNQDNFNYSEFIADIFEQVKNFDKDAVCWITGSLAKGTFKKKIVNQGRRFEVHFADHEDCVNCIKDVGATKNFYGPQSDIDLEIISDKNDLTQEKLSEIIRSLISQVEELNVVIPRIDVTKYSRKDVNKYITYNQKDFSIHNFFLYKLLLGEKSVIDSNSSRVLNSYVNRFLLVFQLQLEQLENQIGNDNSLSLGEKIRQIKTVSVALGYLEKFKPYKHSLQNGEAQNPLYFDLDSNFGDYLNLRFNQENVPVSSKLPYGNGNKDCFKVVIPKIDFLFNHFHESDDTSLIIVPPLSSYDRQIHFGQLLNTYVGKVVERFSKYKYPERQVALSIDFQTSGPYWEKQTDIKCEEIESKIADNIRSITYLLDNFGIDIPSIRTDMDFENKRSLIALIEQWHRLGLLFIDENNVIHLRVGAGLKMFGENNIFNKIKSMNLVDIIRNYSDNHKIISIEPDVVSDKYCITIKSSISDKEFQVYPTFSVLTLPFANGLKKYDRYEIICGENIATQFALGHAISLQSISRETANIDATIFRLVTDKEGRRMTRLRGNAVFFRLEDDNQIIMYTESSEGKRSILRVLNNDSDFFATAFEFLRMMKIGGENARFVNTNFKEGYKTFDYLRNITKYVIMKGFLGRTEIITLETTRDVKMPTEFSTYLESREIGKAVLFYYKFILKLSRNLNQFKTDDIYGNDFRSLLIQQYKQTVVMTTILFGAGSPITKFCQSIID